MSRVVGIAMMLCAAATIASAQFGVHPKHGKSWELSLNAKYADVTEPRYRYDLTKPLAFQMDAIS